MTKQSLRTREACWAPHLPVGEGPFQARAGRSFRALPKEALGIRSQSYGFPAPLHSVQTCPLAGFGACPEPSEGANSERQRRDDRECADAVTSKGPGLGFSLLTAGVIIQTGGGAHHGHCGQVARPDLSEVDKSVCLNSFAPKLPDPLPPPVVSVWLSEVSRPMIDVAWCHKGEML